MKTEVLDCLERNSSMNSKHPQPGWGKWTRRAALVCVVSVMAACALTALAGPVDVGGKKDFKVYQGNAYVGGPIEAPLTLDPTDPNYASNLLVTVTAVYQQIVASDPAARMAGLAAEIAARIVEQAFWSLDAPIGRVCSEEVPIPYPRHLEEAAIPQTANIIAAAKAALGRA